MSAKEIVSQVGSHHKAKKADLSEDIDIEEVSEEGEIGKASAEA